MPRAVLYGLTSTDEVFINGVSLVGGSQLGDHSPPSIYNDVNFRKGRGEFDSGTSSL